jgi:pimeloyl-ACP methyl ester carboxylesterase
VPEVRVNGHRLSYEDAGSGTPVLFIHGGYGGALTSLAPTPPVIRTVLPADRFRLVTYDRRGCGASEYVDSDYTLEDLAADGIAVLDHLAIGRALIIGTSAGGPIALQLALKWHQRVIALCLPNTGSNLMDQERETSRQRKELVERVRAEGARPVFETRKHRLRAPVTLDAAPNEDAAATARRERSLATLAALSDDDLFRYSMGEIRNFAAYLGFDFGPRLSELKMPVCIIHGTADQTVPFAWGRALHEGIPGSEFHAIEGGVHGIVSNPAAGAVLRDWAGRMAASEPHARVMA